MFVALVVFLVQLLPCFAYKFKYNYEANCTDSIFEGYFIILLHGSYVICLSRKRTKLDCGDNDSSPAKANQRLYYSFARGVNLFLFNLVCHKKWEFKEYIND